MNKSTKYTFPRDDAGIGYRAARTLRGKTVRKGLSYTVKHTMKLCLPS